MKANPASPPTQGAQHIWLPTASGPMPIAVVGEGRQYAVHADHLNTPRRLTQEDGKVAWQWAYSAFGDEQPTTAANRFTSESTNPTTGSTSVPQVQYSLRYPGQYFDNETSLHYNYFRSYDSRTGRYTQGDPIGLDGGRNRFAYVGGNPLSFVDPEGLAACLVNFPDMPIDTGYGFSMDFGHSGILTYDSKGGTQYHEYGRYKPEIAMGAGLPEKEGNVRRMSVPDLALSKDGSPTPTSMEILRRTLSEKAGKGTPANLTCDVDADEQKTREHIRRIAEDAKRKKYSWIPLRPNQCHSFASDAFNAGRQK